MARITFQRCLRQTISSLEVHAALGTGIIVMPVSFSMTACLTCSIRSSPCCFLERDELGPQLVPDYLTSVREGGFYGWPYSYYGRNVDPRIKPARPDLVRQAIVPDYALGSHVAALGVDFTSVGGLGGQFSEGAFVGQHGSWNRADPSGYKVVFVPFAGGRPRGEPVDLVTGFLKDGHARGRPVGVTYDAARRVLLVADDVSNTVWRIAPSSPATWGSNAS